MRPVVLPILDANMTHGIVRAWFKKEGDAVEAGEVLFEVETDKINAEVEAEVSGVLRQIVVPVGTRAPVLSILAFVGTLDEALPAVETWSALIAPVPSGDGPTFAPAPPAQPAVERVAATPAARRLARQRRVALDRISGTGPAGEITRADVEAADAVATVSYNSDTLDPAFLDRVRADVDAFRALSSDMKVALYRQHGAQIGEHVRIERGAIIVAASLSIGAGSSLGADSTIECDQMHVGRLVAFGKRTRVRCRGLEIGDALWSKDDVVIGGGGSDEPDARLVAGSACFFGEGAYLNTCHPLTLGDEVCIGSRAMLFTHSHWQSVLRGYPSLFGPIQVGDHVFIGNTAFVFPGVTIGAGATVMVNSFVAMNVPADTLVGGVPAQVVRHILLPSRSEQIDLVRERLMPELVTVLGRYGSTVVSRGDGEILNVDVDASAAVCFVPSWGSATVSATRPRVVVVTFADEAEISVPPGMTVFDLQASRVHGVQDQLSDEVREYCRRRGIRFRPLSWRYGVGHFEGERFVRRSRDGDASRRAPLLAKES